MSLRLYKPLTSNDANVRLKAASELTSQLLALVESDPSPLTDDTGTGAETNQSIQLPTLSTNPEPSPNHLKRPKEEINYALTRLIKGLASGHESARFGFAVVLTEYLRVLLQPHYQVKWGVNVEFVCGLVHKWMEITEHLSRIEQRDRWLGRLFGLKAVIMSGCLYQANGCGIGQEREFRTVVGEILDLGREKSWLREPGMWTVVTAARKFNWSKEYVMLVWRMVVERDLVKTSEGVGVWLCFEELCPGIKSEGVSPLMADNLVVLAKVLKESGAAGGEKGEGGDMNPRGEGQEQGKSKGKGKGIGGRGVWNPRLHWVWDEIIQVYLKQANTGSKGLMEKQDHGQNVLGNRDDRNPENGNIPMLKIKGDIAPFEHFWRIVVDESLFSASSSEERKFHGFLLLIKVLNLLTSTPQYIPHLLPHLFTRNLLRCTINHHSDPSRYLHKSAAKSVSTIQKLATAHSSSIPFIVRGLILGNGTTGFDRLTKTKTIEKLLPLAGENENALTEVVETLRDITVAPPTAINRNHGEDDDSTDQEDGGEEKENIKGVRREEESKRQWAADQLLSLVRSGKGRKHGAWITTVVETFTVLGHFDLSNYVQDDTPLIIRRVLGGMIPSPKVSQTSRCMFRSRLMSVLGHLLDSKGEEMNRDTWPCQAVRVIRQMTASGGMLAMEFDEQIGDVIASGWERLEAIRANMVGLVSGIAEMGPGTAREDEKLVKVSQLQAFELLYSMVLLQTYNGDSDAVELFGELEEIYERLMEKVSAIDMSSKYEERGMLKDATCPPTNNYATDSCAVLVDLVLSFLAKPSVLLRKIAGLVWSRFVGTPVVGKSALIDLLTVLETKESVMGHQELFDRDESDESGEEEDDVEMDSDVEEIDEPGESMDVGKEYQGVKLIASEGQGEEGSFSDMKMSTPSSDEETDIPTDEETVEFETALSKALRIRKATPTQPMAPENSDSDTDMTDSEMMSLDAHLSVMFRERLRKLQAPQAKKKEITNAKENVLVFKGKVLELLEAYVKMRFVGGKDSQGDGGLFLVYVVPRLLCVMRTTGSPQFREKLSSLLKLFVRESGKVGGGAHDAESEDLWKTLEVIHEEVLREGGGMGHTVACSMVSIATVKAILRKAGGNGMSAVGAITGIYAQTMTSWLISGGVGGVSQSASKLQIQSFFTDFVGWGGSVRKATATVVEKGAKKEVAEGTEGTTKSVKSRSDKQHGEQVEKSRGFGVKEEAEVGAMDMDIPLGEGGKRKQEAKKKALAREEKKQPKELVIASTSKRSSKVKGDKKPKVAGKDGLEEPTKAIMEVKSLKKEKKDKKRRTVEKSDLEELQAAEVLIEGGNLDREKDGKKGKGDLTEKKIKKNEKDRNKKDKNKKDKDKKDRDEKDKDKKRKEKREGKKES